MASRDQDTPATMGEVDSQQDGHAPSFFTPRAFRSPSLRPQEVPYPYRLRRRCLACPRPVRVLHQLDASFEVQRIRKVLGTVVPSAARRDV